MRIAFAGVGKLDSGTLARISFDVIADDISPLKIERAELYGPDAFPLISRCIDREFRSWAVAPERSALLQNFPNPFNPETWISYQLKEASEVKIRIYCFFLVFKTNEDSFQTSKRVKIFHNESVSNRLEFLANFGS